MIHEATKRYTWDATEKERPDKSIDWYWGLGIVTVTAIILSIIAKNYLFAVLMALGGFMLGWFANDKPELVRVEISDQGLKINKDLYSFKNIESFWMYNDHRNEGQILFIINRALMPKHVISAPKDISINELRSFLLRHIEEKETKPSAVDTIIDSVGF